VQQLTLLPPLPPPFVPLTTTSTISILYFIFCLSRDCKGSYGRDEVKVNPGGLPATLSATRPIPSARRFEPPSPPHFQPAHAKRLTPVCPFLCPVPPLPLVYHYHTAHPFHTHALNNYFSLSLYTYIFYFSFFRMGPIFFVCTASPLHFNSIRLNSAILLLIISRGVTFSCLVSAAYSMFWKLVFI